ncbi:retrovirus-related pol polyprotein from transposon TNT 1-94 [Tanacetum coccineum]
MRRPQSSYFSDENSSIDDLALDNEYDKLCKMSLKIIAKKKRLKSTRNSLENKLRELKDKLSTLEKNKGVDLDCAKCHALKIENEKLKEESTRLNKSEKTSSSGTKEIKFVKAQKKVSSGGGLGIDLEPNEWINDRRFSKDMTGNRKLFSTYKAYNGGNVIFGGNLYSNIIGKGQICDNKFRVTFSEHNREITKDGRVIGKQAHASHKAKIIVSTTRCLELLHMDLFGPSSIQSYEGNRYTLVIVDDYSSKACIILNKHTRKVEELLNVTFDETPPPSKTSPLLDDDLDEEEAIREIEKKNLKNVVKDETLEIDEIVSIKEYRNHPLENVIGNLNQRTLRSQAQNQSNFFCFISTIEPKNVNEDLGDESWIVVVQEELNQFIANDVWELVRQPKNMKIIGTKLFAQGYNQQESIDYDETYASVARLESIRILLAYACALDFKLFQMDVKSAFLNGFINEELEMSMMGELNFFLGLQIKQMEDGIFFNQSKYIKEMLKKFGLEDSKPMKTPMSSDTKLTKDEECESVDSTKYRGMIGSLLYLMASRPDIMFSVCLCARFQEAPKTSHLEAVKRIF